MLAMVRNSMDGIASKGGCVMIFSRVEGVMRCETVLFFRNKGEVAVSGWFSILLIFLVLASGTAEAAFKDKKRITVGFSYALGSDVKFQDIERAGEAAPSDSTGSSGYATLNAEKYTLQFNDTLYIGAGLDVTILEPKFDNADNLKFSYNMIYGNVGFLAENFAVLYFGLGLASLKLPDYDRSEIRDKQVYGGGMVQIGVKILDDLFFLDIKLRTMIYETRLGITGSDESIFQNWIHSSVVFGAGIHF